MTKTDLKPHSNLASSWLPGLTYVSKFMSNHFQEYTESPTQKVIAIASFFMITLTQYALAQKYWHHLDSILTSYPDLSVFV